MNARHSVRRGSTKRAAGICIAAAVVVLVPRIALAADSGAPTIRALIGSNGSVSSVKQYTPDGATSAFGGQLPVTMKITHTASGAANTFTYHVENTFTQTQTIHYDDTAGNAHHTSVQLQLPLVAQLGVDVPAAMGAIDAAGATVTEEAGGTRHVLWNMVLFTPLGSSAQDVSFTTAGAGNPVAELRATAVDPTTTPGLSSASQTATAGFQQDDFWAGFASGGNSGLDQLSTGTASLVDGLVQLFAGATQLHNGIVTAGDGANKLDVGTKSAYVGSKKLSAGLGLIHGGLNKSSLGLTGGLRLIHDGLNNTSAGLTGGLTAIHNGQASLTSGISDIHAGQASLTTGLQQLAGGLAQFADPVNGLQKGVVGLTAIQGGVQAMLAGVGADGTPSTLLDGVKQLHDGAEALKSAFTNPTTGINVGVACSIDVMGVVINGNATPAVADPCFAAAPFNGIRPLLPSMASIGAVSAGESAILQGVLTNALNPIYAGLTNPSPASGVVAGISAISAGASLIHGGLSHPAGAGGPTDPGGLKEGLSAVNAGL
ncbi:MAG: putative rane protein, partial [Frankiaceae bacterium]|nr:putative rane protein [Frankiaceae bacterium]